MFIVEDGQNDLIGERRTYEEAMGLAEQYARKVNDFDPEIRKYCFPIEIYEKKLVQIICA